MIVPLLQRNTELWWSSVQGAYDLEGDRISWREFKRIFYKHFFPKVVRIAKEEDFMTIRHKEGMTILEYANKFNELGYFCPQIINNLTIKARRFEQGLEPMIQSSLIPLMLDDYKDILKRALRIKTEVQRIGTRKEDWKKIKIRETVKPEVKKTKDEAEQPKIFPC